MATVNDQGTRLYYAAANQAWVDLAAGVAPNGANYTEVTRLIKVDVDPMEMEEYDDSALAATSPDPQIDIKPGEIMFSKDKVSSETKILRGFCDGSTSKCWVVLYKDGTADYCASGKLIPVKGASAQRGDFKKHIVEDYKIQSAGTIVPKDAA